jgi:hypothetical protein
MTYLTVFAQNSVKTVSSSDFNLDTPDKITMKSKDCMVVLFYGENTESKSLSRIWSLVAQQTAGPIVTAVNVMADPKIATAMTDIRGMGSHAYHWAAMKGYPFILSYRGGIPVAFYNGERSVQAILDWVMTLACQANYYEREDISAGVKVDSNDLSMPSAQPYPSAGNPVRVQSTQFTSAAPLRGSGAAPATTTAAAAATTPPAAAAPITTAPAPAPPGAPPGAPPTGPQVIAPQ